MKYATLLSSEEQFIFLFGDGKIFSGDENKTFESQYVLNTICIKYKLRATYKIRISCSRNKTLDTQKKGVIVRITHKTLKKGM